MMVMMVMMFVRRMVLCVAFFFVTAFSFVFKLYGCVDYFVLFKLFAYFFFDSMRVSF